MMAATVGELMQLTGMNPTTENALARLIKAVGKEKALRVGGEILGRMGTRELRSQNEVLVFANHLITHGGVVATVGYALKVSALLRGAVESA